jgi:CheY-like chemotaxis protein
MHSMNSTSEQISGLCGQAVDLQRAEILLVDDEPVLLEEISEYLEEAGGYMVTAAHDGQAALEVYRQSPPGRFGVVLTDLRMPGLTGYSLARSIIEQTRDDHAAEVIVLTGHGVLATEPDAPDGIFALVRKPLRLAHLCELVTRAHDAAQARRHAAFGDGHADPAPSPNLSRLGGA